MLGKIEGGRRRQRMRWLGSITDAMDMSLSRLWELVMGREAWHGPWGCKELDMTDWNGDFQDMGHHPLFGVLTAPWNCHDPSGCVISLVYWGLKSCLPSWSHWILISLCCVFSLCHTFRSSALPLSLLLYNHLTLCCLLPSIFPSISVFLIGRLFPSDGQRIEASVSASILPVNIQGWFPLGLTSLISLSKGLSRVFSNTTVRKHQFFRAQPFLGSSFHTHNMTAGKTKALTIQTFLAVMPLIFNILSRFVIAFLPRSMCLLISWLQSPSAVILKPKKIKSVTASIFSTSICHELMLWSLFFECWVLS